VAIGDFNGDGKSDLVVNNANDNTVSVLLGNGDGTFQAQVTYQAGSGPYSVTLADLNGDGKLDLVVPNAYDQTVSVLLGNGDGTFQTQATYLAGVFPASVAVGDFNGDGKPDLVVALQGAYSVSVLLGNGDGTFQTHVLYQVAGAGFPTSVLTGEFNGDGVADIAVAGYAADQVSILLGLPLTNQTITFGTLPSHTYGDTPFTVSATATSRLTVTFGSMTPLVCTTTLSGSVTIAGAGTCSITASQGGNSAYSAAQTVPRASR
jgi:hypothetical protein